MRSIVGFTHLRRDALLNRINDMNHRVQRLAGVAGLEGSDKLLADEVTAGLQALRINRSAFDQSQRCPKKVGHVLSAKDTKYSRLVEDILLLVLEILSPNIDIEKQRISNDIKTLQSMRLTNQYFAALVEEKLFSTIGIGRAKDPASILPEVVIRHVRFLKIHPYAYNVPFAIWAQVITLRIDGIRCDGAVCPLPYWKRLGIVISPSSVTHFTCHLNFLSVFPEDINDFSNLIQVLSPTVRVASFNLEATSNACREAFTIIQKKLSQLTSLDLSNISRSNSSWALQQNWSCIEKLRTLRIRSSRLPFSFLANFIAYASTVINLAIEDCIPQDASEEVVFLGLEKDRNFKELSIPSVYRDGPFTGSIVVFRYPKE
ncbi:hypothetical protein CPB86DRAFT_820759 [Serendipita vermifera]|nr:hypothetical protein CPB86DRAFT_820759 [Serendipita vermifera]